MSEASLSGRLAAAAALLLRPPQADTLALLSAACQVDLDPRVARQDFYDILCVPQSGRYVPPYAHVLAQGRQVDEYRHFPQARYDGGDGLRPWYDAVGFDPLSLDVDPMNQGPHRPLDHVGYVLAFAAGLAEAAESSETARGCAVGFVAECLGDWIDGYADLLARSESRYINLVAGALAEAVAELRERHGEGHGPWFDDAMSSSAAAAS